MSFDLTETAILWIPVTWPTLKAGEDDEIATVTEARIDLLVEILDRDELKRIFFTDEDGEDVSDFDGFKQIVKGWRKLVSGKDPVPFDDVHIKKLLAVAAFNNAFQTAYLKACSGVVEVREGNSEGSPPVGRAGVRSRRTPKGRA